MHVSRYRAIHRYGALISVVAIIGAVLSIIIRGPLQPLIFPLGFYGPLSGFYFIGSILGWDERYRILGEELMRGVVWYGGSLLAWAMVITSSTVVPATPVTVLGLPAITALGLALMMVGIRRGTGLDLKVQTEGGQLLVAITGAIVGGFIVLYSVLVEGWSPLLVVVYVFATAGGLFFWHQRWL